VLYRTNLLNDTIYAIKTLALHLTLSWAFVPKLGHQLNQPSWALSVFFLCYILTPSFSKFLNRQNKKTLWLLFLGTWLISLLAVVYFKELPNVIRGINFFSGMLLGKLFINNAISLPAKAWLNDLLLLFTAILLFSNIHFFRQFSVGLSYHIISPVLYSAFLLFLSNNKGVIVKVLSVSPIRDFGKVSFYAYLLHGVVIEFLHLYLDKVALWRYNPFNNFLATLIIIILLYGTCVLYNKRKR
jgi:peptidoglycan/LPS O-acetylase OafA/YrhL